MVKKVKKWYPQGGRSLGWHKDDSQTTRLRNAVKARRGNELKAARGLQALSNVTVDAETKRKAKADAKILYARHRKQK